MNPTNESGLVKKIIREVKKRYPKSFIMKVHGSPVQMAGVPDLLVCLDGYLYAFEVKFQRPGESAAHAYGRVSTIQQAQIDALNESGATAVAVLTVDEVLEALG